MLRIIACVFIGSGIGGALRYLVSVWVNNWFRCSTSPAAIFPWATLFVNIAGCFIIGLLYGLIDSHTVEMSPATKALLTTGFCGGLTTFSTFSHENYILFQSGNPGITLLYAALSIVIGFGAAWLGHTLVR